jgi:DNA-binding beta-propeller fold protein YncE
MPAAINVAGDASDPNGPTYATFASVLDAAPLPIGTPQAPFAISQSIDRQGNVSEALHWANYGIGTAYLDEITNHSIAQPFWSFMNSTGTVYENGAYIQDALFENAFFATGRPITEAYWSSVLVGGAPADVLIQCFERRCLTYTPDNAPEWQVESGNVGQHYYRWLYEQDGEAQGPCPDSSEGAYLYVADQFNDRVQKFNGAGDFICTWGGGDPPTSFRRPIALKVGPDGYIYVLAETGIHKYNYRGGFEAHIALPESGALDFAVTHAGLLVVPSVIDSSIQIHDTLGNLVHEWGSMGTGQGQFDQPWGVAVDADDNIYVVDHNNYRVQIFNPSGDFVTEFGVEGEADHNTEFTFPIGITVDDSGGVYVVDSGYVKMFGLQGGYVPTGIWGSTLGEGYAGDNSIVVTTTGKSLAYVTDTFNEQVHVFSYSFGANGAEELNLIGDFGTAEGQFDNPVGIGVNGR